MQSIKYSLFAASLAAIADAQGVDPKAYLCAVGSNMLPQVTTTIQSQGPFQMNIETNSNNNLAFTNFCTQEIDSTTVSYCSDAPTFVTDAVDDQSLFGIGDDFAGNMQGGWTTDGRIVTGTVATTDTAAGSTTMTQPVYTVRSITESAWNYNVQNMGAGSLSLAAGSPTITGTESSGLSGFALETGPVTDQSFAGGSAAITPNLYIGQGDYSSIFTQTNPHVNPLADSTGAYPLESVGFGVLTFDVNGDPSSTYFSSLGVTNQT